MLTWQSQSKKTGLGSVFLFYALDELLAGGGIISLIKLNHKIMPKQEQMPSPDEQAEIEKSRAISDAELLKGGAKYEIKEAGEKTLSPTVEQTEEMRREMKDALRERIEKRFERRQEKINEELRAISEMCGFSQEELKFYINHSHGEIYGRNYYTAGMGDHYDQEEGMERARKYNNLENKFSDHIFGGMKKAGVRGGMHDGKNWDALEAEKGRVYSLLQMLGAKQQEINIEKSLALYQSLIPGQDRDQKRIFEELVEI